MYPSDCSAGVATVLFLKSGGVELGDVNDVSSLQPHQHQRNIDTTFGLQCGGYVERMKETACRGVSLQEHE